MQTPEAKLAGILALLTEKGKLNPSVTVKAFVEKYSDGNKAVSTDCSHISLTPEISKFLKKLPHNLKVPQSLADLIQKARESSTAAPVALNKSDKKVSQEY